MNQIASLDRESLLRSFWRPNPAVIDLAVSPHSDYVTVAQAARIVGLSPQGVYYHLHRDQFVTEYRLHDRIVFRRADVEAWATGRALDDAEAA